MIISVSRWAQFVSPAENLRDLFRRDIKDWHYITACHLNSWVIGMGLANVRFVDALISARHSAGIELIILIRKNLFSGL